MELLLLGAGAIILIAITLWIVWPARTADAVGATVQPEEVSRRHMTENVGSERTPQSERLSNQYTSAGMSTSNGGVGAVGVADTLPASGHGPSAAETSASRWSAPAYDTEYSSPLPSQAQGRSLAAPRTLGLGAGALLSISGAVGGAWLYARWQRERNKPLNRLRRGAREVASRVGERMPEDLPRGAAPMSGAATALLLSGLVASRAMRRDSAADRTVAAREQTTDLLRDQATDLLRELAARPRQPAIMGLGMGGLALVAGGAYLVWRLLRGDSANTSWSSSSAGE